MAIEISEGLKKEITDMVQLFDDIENELLRQIARETSKGKYVEGWRENKLRKIKQVKKESKKIIESGFEKIEPKYLEITKKSYIEGVNEAERQIDDIFKDRIEKGLGKTGEIDLFKIKALAKKMKSDLKGKMNNILSSVQKSYIRVINDSSVLVSAAVLTKDQAIQRSLDKMADKGISMMRTSDGRNLSIRSYADMAIRTNVVNANVEGTIDRLWVYGFDLYIVSEHPEECPLCTPWEGQILQKGN